MDIKEAREKWPMYSDLSDMQLAEGVKRKYYPEKSVDEVAAAMGIQQQAVPESAPNEYLLATLWEFETQSCFQIAEFMLLASLIF